MSGGHFDYFQYRINSELENIKESMEIFLDCFESEDQAVKAKRYFDECIKCLERGAFLMQRIDYLISGDDGPDCFFRRIKDGE